MDFTRAPPERKPKTTRLSYFFGYLFAPEQLSFQYAPLAARPFSVRDARYAMDAVRVKTEQNRVYLSSWTSESARIVTVMTIVLGRSVGEVTGEHESFGRGTGV